MHHDNEPDDAEAQEQPRDLPSLTIGHPITAEDVAAALDEDDDASPGSSSGSWTELVARIQHKTTSGDVSPTIQEVLDEQRAERLDINTRVRLRNVACGLDESGTDADLDLG